MRRTLLCAFLLALQLPVGTALYGADEEIAEYRVKAAYLFKFCGYIEWPQSAFAAPDSPILIGVRGAEALAADLEIIAANRTVAGRRVEVRRLGAEQAAEEVQVLFVGRDAVADPAVPGIVDSAPVLLVTEADDAAAGGVINFVLVDNKVRFDISTRLASARNLRISARLLDVARNVANGSS